MYHYEKFDFTNDGLIDTTNKKVIPHISKELSNI